jgi:hypothetical protein
MPPPQQRMWASAHKQHKQKQHQTISHCYANNAESSEGTLHKSAAAAV